MEYGINSISYLFIPEQSNEKLILYHQGHGGDFLLGKDTIQFFLDRNFTVISYGYAITWYEQSTSYRNRWIR